jgi:hypothetical protein
MGEVSILSIPDLVYSTKNDGGVTEYNFIWLAWWYLSR